MIKYIMDNCSSGIMGHCEVDGNTGNTEYITPQQAAFQQYDKMLNNRTETYVNYNNPMNWVILLGFFLVTIYLLKMLKYI